MKTYKNGLMSILENKTVALSFRIPVKDLKKLDEGKPVTVSIRGVSISMKKETR